MPASPHRDEGRRTSRPRSGSRPGSPSPRFGLTPRNVRSVRTRARTNTATIGPDDAAAAAGEAHATEHDGGHALERVGPGHRRADPGASRSGPARPTPRRARSARRRRPSSGRRRRRCGTPPAGCCRSRTATGRAVERRSGIQTTATKTTRTTSARGSQSMPSEPVISAISQSAAPPPGVLQDEQRGAGPDERHRQRHDDVRHPRDDDQCRR